MQYFTATAGALSWAECRLVQPQTDDSRRDHGGAQMIAQAHAPISLLTPARDFLPNIID
jgi:hypothetical protein